MFSLGSCVEEDLVIYANPDLKIQYICVDREQLKTWNSSKEAIGVQVPATGSQISQLVLRTRLLPSMTALKRGHVRKRTTACVLKTFVSALCQPK